ncbi:MAG: hypothetical protein U0S48_06950 [Solirubrobacteraceae bacterium]
MSLADRNSVGPTMFLKLTEPSGRRLVEHRLAHLLVRALVLVHPGLHCSC